MKVICIACNIQQKIPEVGREYTVINTFMHRGKTYFELEELQIDPFGNPCDFWEGMFAPLDGPDETHYADEVLNKIFQPVEILEKK